MLHTTAHVIVMVAWAVGGIIGMWGTYYGAQAINHIRRDSPRYGLVYWLNSRQLRHTDFTERGRFYHRRAMMTGTILLVWMLAFFVLNILVGLLAKN
jgi:hypothetical protein